MEEKTTPRVKHYHPLQVANDTSFKDDNSSRRISLNKELQPPTVSPGRPGPFLQDRRSVYPSDMQEMMASGNKCSKGLAYMTHMNQTKERDPLKFASLETPSESPLVRRQNSHSEASSKI